MKTLNSIRTISFHRLTSMFPVESHNSNRTIDNCLSVTFSRTMLNAPTLLIMPMASK